MLGLRIAALILALLAALPASAVQPDEVLSDPALEARARTLSRELRCMVCQNQSIDDSDAPLARDLRVLVRERLKQGDSEAQVLDFLVARYGEFVLLKPRFAWHTILLWTAPFAVFVLGVGGIFLALRGRRGTRRPATALTDDERRRVAEIVRREDQIAGDGTG